ncbi:hypothetical protein KAR91_33120 [Candidatus Pacearchaeota archaeon]|nr:hypothetical protein [Candidatus Pacearchaeota archaeon]
MKASEALELSDKIKRVSGKEFAHKAGIYLKWHEGPIVGFDAQIADDWEPFMEGIRPKEGELWEDASGAKWFIYTGFAGVLYKCGGPFGEIVSGQMAHGHHGWTRIHPSVEDRNLLMQAFDSVINDLTKAAIKDSIEVVEIENVDCKSSSTDDRIFRLICEKPEFGPILPLKRYDKVIFIRTKK